MCIQRKALSMSFNFFGVLTVLWVMQTQAEQIHFIKDIPCYEEATSSSEKCNQCFNLQIRSYIKVNSIILVNVVRLPTSFKEFFYYFTYIY